MRLEVKVSRGRLVHLSPFLRCSITIFDGLCDACALQAETIRQCQELLDEMVGAWISDNIGVVGRVKEWCFAGLGWVADKTLLDNSEKSVRVRKLLVSNSNYPMIGSVVEILEDAHALLSRLNVPGHVQLVADAVLNDIDAACAIGRTTVITTFALYLLFEKLPSVADFALKQAELEAFQTTLSSKAPIPAALLDALNAATKPSKA